MKNQNDIGVISWISVVVVPTSEKEISVDITWVDNYFPPHSFVIHPREATCRVLEENENSPNFGWDADIVYSRDFSRLFNFPPGSFDIMALLTVLESLLDKNLVLDSKSKLYIAIPDMPTPLSLESSVQKEKTKAKRSENVYSPSRYFLYLIVGILMSTLILGSFVTIRRMFDIFTAWFFSLNQISQILLITIFIGIGLSSIVFWIKFSLANEEE